MSFLHPETGELAFSDGLRLCGGMPCEALGLSSGQSGLIRLESRAVPGGRLIPLVRIEGGVIRSVFLSVSSIGGHSIRSAAKQRAFLFSRLSLQDPCPDALAPVLIHCPFGEITFSSEPHTGRVEACLIYAARQP